LSTNGSDSLECKVEHYLKGRGYRALLTPPHCPDLQPIEHYWTIGKIGLGSGLKKEEI